MAENPETKATELAQNDENPKDAHAGGEQGEGFKPITSEAELSAYKATLRKSIADEFERKQAEKERSENADRLRVEQEAKGEFDKVKQSLIEERDAVKSDKDAMAAKVASYEKLAAARVESLKVDLKLPEEVLKRFPADAEILAQLAWLEEQGDLATVYRTEGGRPTNGARVPATPQSQGVTKSEYERAVEQMRGRISI